MSDNSNTCPTPERLAMSPVSSAEVAAYLEGCGVRSSMYPDSPYSEQAVREWVSRGRFPSPRIRRLVRRFLRDSLRERQRAIAASREGGGRSPRRKS